METIAKIIPILYFIPSILIFSCLTKKNRPQNYFVINLIFGRTGIVRVGLIIEFFIFHIKESKEKLLEKFLIKEIDQKK